MATSSERLIPDLNSPDETTRRCAVEDLGDCGDEAAIELAVRALADPSPAVCEAALDTLARIGGIAVVQAVLPALRSERVRFRNAATVLLSELGETAAEYLAGMTSDEDRDVRLFAIDTLTRIRSRTAETAIIRALKDPDINVAAAAAAALGEIGAVSAVPSLIAALTADSWVRCSVAKSLGQIGGIEATTTLAALTGDVDELVVYAALLALTRMEDATARRVVFRGLVNHSNPVIRSAAAAALERLSPVGAT